MKQKFLLSLLFVCSLAITTQAQINKGATWLGGSFAYGQSTEKSLGSTITNKTSGFTISPAIGKAVKDNLVVGAFATYQHSRSKSGSTTTAKYNTYGGGVFVRKYIPIVSQLYLFGDARVYVNRATESTSGTSDYKAKSWNVGISATPGLSYAVTKGIQIETGVYSLFSVSYQKKDQTVGSNNGKYNTFNAGLLLDNHNPLYIGFRFLLNNKKA